MYQSRQLEMITWYYLDTAFDHPALTLVDQPATNPFGSILFIQQDPSHF